VWRGSGIDEKAVDSKTGRTIIRVSSDFYRPTERLPLVGNATKARRELGWQPTMSFQDLARTMAEEELKRTGR